MLGNLGKKALLELAVPLAKNGLPKLATKATLSILDKLERKISGEKKAGKGFTLFISKEYINDIIKIVKSLEDSGVLIDGVTETVKHEIKKQEGGFFGTILPPLAASVVEPVVSSVLKSIIEIGVMRSGKGHNNMNHTDKIF